MPAHADRDLERWLAGDAAAGGRLAATLRQPEVAAAVLRRLVLEEALRERLHARRRRRVRLLRWGWAALAAGLLLAALALLPPAVPAIVADGAGTIALRDGLPVFGPLRPGDRVTGAAARLALGDGSVLALSPGGALTVAAQDRSAIAFALDAGALSVHAAHQPAGRELRVSTPEATVRVVGTRFTVERWAGGSRVAVEEGLVAVDPADGGAGRLLAAGADWELGLPRPLLRLLGETVFDGGAGAWRELGPLPGTPDGITIQVLARAEPAAMGARLIGIGEGAWQQNINFMQWDSGLVLQVKQNLRPGEAVSEEQLEARDAVLPGTWAVYEATIAADGMARILRDGALLAEGRLMAPVDVPRAHAWVARSFYDNPLWRGAISDLRVYPRALRPDESRAALRTFVRP